MSDDLRRIIYGTIFGFLGVVVLWVTTLYLFSCGFTLSCHSADLLVVRTPVPTLIPVEHTDAHMDAEMPEFTKCQIGASDLVGAWVSAGSPETEAFPFTDINGQSCEGTYANDIQPLLTENGIWKQGTIGCVSCHNSTVAEERSAGLDFTSYSSLTAKDIFGGGNWESSALFNVLVNQGLVKEKEGHSADEPASNPILYVGEQVEPVATPTP